MLLPWLSTVQLLHCHSAEDKCKKHFAFAVLASCCTTSFCHVASMTPDSPVLGDEGSEVRLSCRTDAAMASRGRSQVVHRTARISLTVVQWEHSHGDRDGLEEHRQLKMI